MEADEYIHIEEPASTVSNDDEREKVEEQRDEEEDDEDEEELEPKLKYERLSNDIGRILKSDTASCIAVHPKVSSSSSSFSMFNRLLETCRVLFCRRSRTATSDLFDLSDKVECGG